MTPGTANSGGRVDNVGVINIKCIGRKMNQGGRKKSLGWRDEEVLDSLAPVLVTPAWEAPGKKRGIRVVGIKIRAEGVASTRPV